MPVLERAAPGATAAGLLDVVGRDVKVLDLYQDGANIYDALVHADAGEQPEILSRTRHLRGRVLDLGCGSGRLTLPFAARRRDVVAVDSSPKMLDLLVRRLALLPHAARSHVEPLLADMARLPEGIGVFDVVLVGTSNLTLLSAEDRRALFARVVDLLSAEGVLLVTLLNLEARPVAATDIRVSAATDLDGRRYLVTIIEERMDGTDERAVDIVAQCTSDAAQGIAVYLSRPRVLDEGAVLTELLAAGLAVTDRAVLGSPDDGREVVLLTLQATR